MATTVAADNDFGPAVAIQIGGPVDGGIGHGYPAPIPGRLLSFGQHYAFAPTAHKDLGATRVAVQVGHQHVVSDQSGFMLPADVTVVFQHVDYIVGGEENHLRHTIAVDVAALHVADRRLGAEAPVRTHHNTLLAIGRQRPHHQQQQKQNQQYFGAVRHCLLTRLDSLENNLSLVSP
jgi:hypothetical protein